VQHITHPAHAQPHHHDRDPVSHIAQPHPHHHDRDPASHIAQPHPHQAAHGPHVQTHPASVPTSHRFHAAGNRVADNIEPRLAIKSSGGLGGALDVEQAMLVALPSALTPTPPSPAVFRDSPAPIWPDRSAQSFNDDRYVGVQQVSWDPKQFSGIGTPVYDSHFWHEQHGGQSCAVVAQAGIYEELTQHSLPEDEAIRIAQEHGLFDPATGTKPQDMGKLLQLLGVPTDIIWGASIADIAQALEHGDKILVGVNGNEIWSPVHDAATGMPMRQSPAGHAVWVIGLETTPIGPLVILNDSGMPDGRGEAVSLWDFEAAWDEFGNEMVVAHRSAATLV
jgi:hypothetical protein